MAGFNGTDAPVITLQFKKSGVWTTVSADDYLEIVLRRGRTNVLDTVPPGILAVNLNNRSGIYDPSATTGTWVVSGSSIIKPGLEVRLLATWSGTDYTLFVGYLTTPIAVQDVNPYVTLRFADGLWLIDQVLAPVLTTAQMATYANETTSTRVGRLLDVAGWPAAARSLTGSIGLNADPQDRSCLAIIRECALAEVGKFYITRSGTAKLEVLADKFTKPTQLAFNDDGTANTVMYASLATETGADQIVNDATIQRAPSKRYRAYNTSSVGSYGYKTQSVPAPVYSDSVAGNLALIYGKQWAEPSIRVASVTFDAMNLGALYPDLLATEIGDLCSVVRHTIDSRTLSFNLVVEGYQYRLSRNGWTATWYTSPVNPYTITL